MSEMTFLRPRLIGGRFEGHSIPLELLKNLAVLEELIIEVARLEFFKDHPDRQRVPRGFTDGIELKLTGIEDGSAVPVISLFVITNRLLFPAFPTKTNQHYFERARDDIVRTIGAVEDATIGAIRDAEESKAITYILTEKTLYYFDRIGQGLRENETIEFITPDNQLSAKLTINTRQWLISAYSMVKERSADISTDIADITDIIRETADNIIIRKTSADIIGETRTRQYIPSTVEELTKGTTVRGTVPEVNQDDMTFLIQSFDGQQIKAPIAPQHFDAILEAFNGYKNDLRFLFQGIGRFYRSEQLLEFDSIERISPLDELDISVQIDDLRLLKDGWLEGQGKAPSKEGLDWLSQAFDKHYSGDLPLPYLYPTEPGGIQAEWSLGQNEITLEIDLAEHSGYFHALHMEDDTEKTRRLDLGSETHWINLKELITSMSENK